jgi:hypothetical protein
MIAQSLIALLFAGQAEPTPRIGVASGDCVSFTGRPIGRESALTVVVLDVAQEVFSARVDRALAECKAASHVQGSSYYAVTWTGAKPSPGFIGIAFLGKVHTRRVASEIVVDLGGRSSRARVRNCTSQEGLHLTVWRAEPLASERLWHEYWYLGYDTEPSCEKRDYEEAAQQ